METLSDDNATPEQKQEAYTALVNEIADYMGVDPTEAKVLMANDPRFVEVAGAHSRDTDTVYVDDAAHDNASKAVNTVGHETQHYRITNRIRMQSRLKPTMITVKNTRI